MRAAGRYVFSPIPLVDEGMTVRLRGDGPSSWTCWLCVGRPRSTSQTIPSSAQASADPAAFHDALIRFLDYRFQRPYDRVLDLGEVVLDEFVTLRVHDVRVGFAVAAAIHSI